MQAPVPLSPPLSDLLLRLAPANLLLFDQDLICRYAAPVHDRLEGRSRESLVGLPADEVLPPARNGLRPVLERACHDAESWHHSAFRFIETNRGRRRDCCWAIQVDPIDEPDFRGVLVSWSDVEAMERERQGLRREVRRLSVSAAERNAALIEVLSDIRNAITPLAGYLQVLTRRPETFKGRSLRDVISELVLPRVADVIEATERLRHPPIYTVEADEQPSSAEATGDPSH